MKKSINRNQIRFLIALLLSSALLSFSLTKIYAIDLPSNSGETKIVDANFSGGTEVSKSTTDGNKLFGTIGSISVNPSLTSASGTYSLKSGQLSSFLANVPKIECLDFTSLGSSTCTNSTTLPEYVKTNGMISVCGPTGCYNKGHFEIDPQNNPSDTLYGIQISTTSNFSSDIYYINGITYTPVLPQNRSINDYKTEAEWEGELFNIRGLKPDTTYYIRATALHGDFTETIPGPSTSASTSIIFVEFDIDIGKTQESDSSAPHLISLLLPPTHPRSASNSIWKDISTNSVVGFNLTNHGEYGSLYKSPTESIPSVNGDLELISDGYGIQNHYSTQEYHSSSGNGDLGEISTSTNYSNSDYNVGAVSTSANTIYSSNKPVLNGRTGTYVKGKSSIETVAGEYSETITFILLLNN
ncbi:MAG TPA: hypothetical protein ENN64_01495 [bacterium]|nr:hypothetical protein [bacterium]